MNLILGLESMPAVDTGRKAKALSIQGIAISMSTKH